MPLVTVSWTKRSSPGDRAESSWGPKSLSKFSLQHSGFKRGLFRAPFCFAVADPAVRTSQQALLRAWSPGVDIVADLQIPYNADRPRGFLHERTSDASPPLYHLRSRPRTSSHLVPGAYAQGETNRLVAGGGISVPGWTGKIDSNAEEAGQTIKDAKLVSEGAALHVTTGPAVTYWNPANKATGNYTVTATFTEPKYMNLNTHPHPYGIVIAGNDMGTAQQSYLYCAAYGNGTFIVRGFGPEPFQMNGRGAENAAVHKAAGVGQPVTQEIALSVKGDRVECAINGTVVASYAKSELVTAGKLKSTDGVYGIRFAHNTDATVTGLTLSKQ